MKIALIALPAKAKYTLDPFAIPRLAKYKIQAVANPAPKKLNRMVIFKLAIGNAIIAIARPKLAPAFTPKIEGLAIGLFVIPCMSAPATAK